MDHSTGKQTKNSLIKFRYAIASHKTFGNKLRLLKRLHKEL